MDDEHDPLSGTHNGYTITTQRGGDSERGPLGKGGKSDDPVAVRKSAARRAAKRIFRNCSTDEERLRELALIADECGGWFAEEDARMTEIERELERLRGGKHE